MEASQIEKLRATAASFASSSIGLWTVALVGYLTSGASWETYFLVTLGTISMMLSVYLVLPTPWKQVSTLEFLEKQKIISLAKMISWLIVLLVFGIRLLQTKILWLIITGGFTVIIAYVVLYVGFWRMIKVKK